MTAILRTKHPCLHREALPPWESDHLYIGDEGRVLCGRCMGIESTYTPWAFSDLGPIEADRAVLVPGHLTGGNPITLHCETDEYAVRRRLGL